jgi:hypothetical protein
MMPSRFFLAGLAAALVGSAAPAFAQTACLQPAERAAFDVRALQSQVMVVALACGEQDQYNAFVTRHSRELGSAFRTISTSYRRAGGQKAVDGYITNLANAQSQDGIRQGTNFCANARPMLQAAVAAPTETGLAEVAKANNLSNPHGRPDCPATPAAATSTRRASAPAARTRQPATPTRVRQASANSR